MTGRERREKILAILETSETVKVSDLARDFLVSEKSIRRDFQNLESKGLIIRFRGGAMRPDTADVSVNQMKLELAEELPVEPPDSKGLDVAFKEGSAHEVEQAWVIKASRPKWIVKAIEKNRPGTIEETQKPKKDLDIIEVGAPIKPETLAELIKLADPESKKTLPIPSEEVARQTTAKEPEPLSKSKKRDKGRGGEERPRRKVKPTQPVKATKKASEKRTVSDVVQIVIALICLIGGTALAIYVLFFAGDRSQGDGADIDMMHELITHEELNFYVPENWNLLEGGGGDTVIRIRGRQGDIIGAMTVSTHEGNPDASLEANFDEISVRIHQGVTDLQSDVIQFGNIPTRRHSYTDPLGEIETSLNTFLIPSGENIKYIQLRKPIDGFNQDLLSQFNEIVRSMNFQPNEFTREQ